ncbi:MAG: hypothetical protein WC614_13600 [bacterium]
MSNGQIYFWLICIATGLIVLILGLKSRCPSCKKWWVRESNGREEIGREGDYKTVKRYDITRDKKGKEISRTERKEQVHITRVTYRNHYQCKNCHHKWTTISTSEYEG